MKYIQSIFVTLLLTFGLSACSVAESEKVPSNDSSLAIRLLPSAKPAYGSNTRVTSDGTAWSEGDVVFIRVVFYADEAMTSEVSSLYTAMRFTSESNWVAATGSADSNAGADFTFKKIDAGANNDLWGINNVILWPATGVKKAQLQAVYAGQHPDVELLSEGNARIRVNAGRISLSEMLTCTRSVSQADLSVPVRLTFKHRLTRLDFGTELSSDIQLKSGSFGSGVGLVPLMIDFSGIVTVGNTANIPVGERYVYITPENMLGSDADRIFRFQDPTSAVVIAAFSIPKNTASGVAMNVTDYYGRSYSLAPQNSGGVSPDDMLPTLVP